MSFNSPSLSLSREPSRTRRILATAGDVSVIILQTLREISDFAPVPLLGAAANTAINIIQTIQNSEQNRDKLLELANDVYNLLLTIHDVCDSEVTMTVAMTSVQQPNLYALSPEMQDMLRMLSRTLDAVQIFIEECQKNSSFFGRLIHHKSISEGIDHHRAEIEKIMRLVQFRSNLIMHRKIDELKRSLERHSQSTESLHMLMPEPHLQTFGSRPAPESDSISEITLESSFRANVRGKAPFDSVYGVQKSQPDRPSSRSERPEDYLHIPQRYGHQALDHVNHRTSNGYSQSFSRSRSPSPFYDNEAAYLDRDFAPYTPEPPRSPPLPTNETSYHSYGDNDHEKHIPHPPWGVFPFPGNNVREQQVYYNEL